MAHMNIDDYMHLELEDGVVVIELLPDLAPNHVNQIKMLVAHKFYDGLTFHRVMDGFMAQTGCPHGTGGGGVSPMVDAEFSAEPHVRGICSMARTEDPNSASCQFFICFTDAPSLNGKYTVWGRVVEGMEFVDNIKRGDLANNGKVDDPDKIISMYRAGEVPINYKK